MLLDSSNRNYVSLMWSEDHDALEVVRQEFEDWLRGKGYDVALHPGVLALKHATVQFLTNDRQTGSSVRLSLHERSSTGIWRTQILGVERPGLRKGREAVL